VKPCALLCETLCTPKNNVELELKEYLMKSFNREVDICSKKWIRPIFKTLVLKEAIYA
jgi:predicted nucleotidyltransferase